MVLLTLFFINNIYISSINGVPVSIFLNIFFILLKYKKKKIKIKRQETMIILGLLLYSLINGFVNSSIYYVYQYFSSVILFIAAFLMYKSYPIKKIKNVLIIVILLNNIITLGLMFKNPFIYDTVLKINKILNVTTRMNYRINGIVGGALKAGILSTYTALLALNFQKGKLGMLLLTSSFLFSFLQARTAIILIIIVILFYMLDSLKIKKIFFLLLVLTIMSYIIINNSQLIIETFPFLKGTIEWQKEGLKNLGHSHSVESLNRTVNIELDKFNNYEIYKKILGNGQGNWKGDESIHSDNGYIVQLLGLGILGTIINLGVYIFLYEKASRRIKKNKSLKKILVLIFILQILLHYKSTSLWGYNYFNLFIFLYFLIIFSVPMKKNIKKDIYIMG